MENIRRNSPRLNFSRWSEFYKRIFVVKSQDAEAIDRGIKHEWRVEMGATRGQSFVGNLFTKTFYTYKERLFDDHITRVHTGGIPNT